MGVVMESFVWEPQPHIYLLLFCLSLLSILAFPHFSTSTSTSSSAFLDHSQSSFLRFQHSFLFIYSLAALNQGLHSVFGEFEYAHYGFTRDDMLRFLSLGSASALLLGTFFGILSDLIGPKKMCFTFCFLHIFVAISKTLTMHPCGFIASVCLALASSVFSFSFETWMVTQNDKLGHRQDMLSDTFWLMVFFESVALIGSQVLGNVLIGADVEKGITFPFIAVVLLAVTLIIFIKREWKETPFPAGVKDYMIALNACILHDKKVCLLACAQSCLHFSTTILWILWAPTIVADGREVHLGLIFPCLMGARMLGSTAVPWFHSGFLQVRIEDCLIFTFSVAGLVLSIVAYDYQEVGVLVTLFCFFHACVGILLPSLARLRTTYVPNELRGGMISLSLAPANAAIVFVLIQGGYFRSIENSTIIAVAAFALFSAAGCIHLLKQKGKQSRQNWHEL